MFILNDLIARYRGGDWNGALLHTGGALMKNPETDHSTSGLNLASSSRFARC